MKDIFCAFMMSSVLVSTSPAFARYYEPQTARFLQEDPILNTGESLYVYARNNPILYFDPLGLRTEVIVWQPVGFGHSSFGHVSVDINGTTYSFGPHAGNGQSSIRRFTREDYLAMNYFRQGLGMELDITAEQELQLQRFLRSYHEAYSFPGNACAAPVQQGLAKSGIDTGNIWIPAGFGMRLIDMELVSRYNSYPALIPPGWWHAPWAK